MMMKWLLLLFLGLYQATECMASVEGKLEELPLGQKLPAPSAPTISLMPGPKNLVEGKLHEQVEQKDDTYLSVSAREYTLPDSPFHLEARGSYFQGANGSGPISYTSRLVLKRNKKVIWEKIFEYCLEAEPIYFEPISKLTLARLQSQNRGTIFVSISFQGKESELGQNAGEVLQYDALVSYVASLTDYGTQKLRSINIAHPRRGDCSAIVATPNISDSARHWFATREGHETTVGITFDKFPALKSCGRHLLIPPQEGSGSEPLVFEQNISAIRNLDGKTNTDFRSLTPGAVDLAAYLPETTLLACARHLTDTGHTTLQIHARGSTEEPMRFEVPETIEEIYWSQNRLVLMGEKNWVWEAPVERGR